MTMHHQYLTAHDIKFPDQKQYTKPGDLILFNDANSALTIYRDEDLIGTVHFSKSGLTEFLRLGWIVRATDVNAKAPVVEEPKLIAKPNVVIQIEDATDEQTIVIEGDLTIRAESIQVDEHTVPSELPAPKRKAKKS